MCSSDLTTSINARGDLSTEIDKGVLEKARQNRASVVKDNTQTLELERLRNNNLINMEGMV